MLRAIEIAEYFLWRACQEESDLISNLKLQKLLYYAIYGQFSAWKLRNMTHEEPLWQNVRNGEVIGITRLREYFLTRVNFRPIVVQTEVSSWDDVAEKILEERHELWEKLARV